MKFDRIYDLNKAVLGRTVAVPVIYSHYLKEKNDRVQYAFDIQDIGNIEKQKELMLNIRSNWLMIAFSELYLSYPNSKIENLIGCFFNEELKSFAYDFGHTMIIVPVEPCEVNNL